MAKTAEQKKKEAAAMKIWAAKHGKLAKKVLEKKTKQSGKEAINKEVHKSSLALKDPAPATKPKAKPSSTKAVRSASTKPAATKPAATTTKPTRSAQANTGSGRDGKFGTGTYGKGRPSDSKSNTGTRGKPLPINPKLKSQSTKNLTGKQKIALEVAAASGGRSSTKRSASRKPANPKKGETYVTRTGMTMVWTGKNWKQKTK